MRGGVVVVCIQPRQSSHHYGLLDNFKVKYIYSLRKEENDADELEKIFKDFFLLPISIHSIPSKQNFQNENSLKMKEEK